MDIRWEFPETRHPFPQANSKGFVEEWVNSEDPIFMKSKSKVFVNKTIFGAIARYYYNSSKT